ncbi:hypothetical protein HZA97_05355 [Candidatus Woesearchaeota archaeon]|nr:hypothetical protein [Candidatus Woesearchaeota archaeon]
MGEVISASQLDMKGLTQLNEVFFNSWINVLKKENPEMPLNTLKDFELKKLESRIKIFPEGQLAFFDKEILGGINSLILGDNIYEIPKKYCEATNNGYFINHNPAKKFLICTAIYVKPGNKGVAKKLLSEATLLAKDNNLTALPYSRPAGFREYLMKIHGKIPKESLMTELIEYLAIKTDKGTCIDPVIGMHEHYGANVEMLLENARNDPESCNFCVLMSYPKGYVVKV